MGSYAIYAATNVGLSRFDLLGQDIITPLFNSTSGSLAFGTVVQKMHSRLEAIAIRLEAIAFRLEAMASITAASP